MKVLATQSCLTLWDPMDYSLLASSVHGNIQARILEWVDIPFSRGSSSPETEPGFPELPADSLLSEPLAIVSVLNTGVRLYVQLFSPHLTICHVHLFPTPRYISP